MLNDTWCHFTECCFFPPNFFLFLIFLFEKLHQTNQSSTHFHYKLIKTIFSYQNYIKIKKKWQIRLKIGILTCTNYQMRARWANAWKWAWNGRRKSLPKWTQKQKPKPHPKKKSKHVQIQRERDIPAHKRDDGFRDEGLREMRMRVWEEAAMREMMV